MQLLDWGDKYLGKAGLSWRNILIGIIYFTEMYMDETEFDQKTYNNK